MPLRINALPYATDRGFGTRGRIGLIAQAGDATIEHDFKAVLSHVRDVELYTSRWPGSGKASHADARALATEIGPVVQMILPGERLDVIALACGTTELSVGEDGLGMLLQRARPGVAITTPIAAIRAALRACGLSQIGVLTPFRAAFNVQIERELAATGITVSVFGSFDEHRDGVISSITEDAIRHNVLALSETARMDGFLIIGTQLRAMASIAQLEREMGIPVIAAGHALIWHCLRTIGIKDPIKGHGLLYGLLG